MEEKKELANKNWHAKSIEDTLSELETSLKGLSREEALKRLDAFGKNSLPSPEKKSTILRFFGHFRNILIYVLLGSAVITFFMEHYIDTGVILAVVLINAIIGFVQEGKAEKAMDSIRQMLALKATVFRDGHRTSVDGQELVSGDIVLLEAGDKVPADIRLIEASSLQVQEAVLTGESVPVEKKKQKVDSAAALGDRFNMLYSGTFVTNGTAKGVVVATGGATEIGRISGMLSEVETLTTPLVEQMDVFARWLTAFILAVAAALLAFGYFVSEHEFSEMFMAVVGLSVAAIPEGLPAVLTITLAVGVQAMARRKAIVRGLPAIETLGSVSVICTDKTGTLTRNEMMVATIISGDHSFTVRGEGLNPFGEILLEQKSVEAKEHKLLEELAHSVALCNDAYLYEKDGSYNVEGDPMEGALLSLARKIGHQEETLQDIWKRVAEIPFNSKNQFMASLNRNSDGERIISVKGAPEKILSMCSTQINSSGEVVPLSKDYWADQSEAIASKGQRVLAIAKLVPANEMDSLSFDQLDQKLSLIGLVGMIDPPRYEAIEAVSECYRAGIEVKMITGDHKKTAAAIGEQIGLKRPENVLTGPELEEISDEELKKLIHEVNIFARTSPEHKLRLVMALQSQGMTVAMTGDGVNDAPALKRADAGIAMGMKGSEAAKEASELVLADDNFATIVAAVREGRTVYDNIKKVISWTLPTNGGEAATIILALLMGLALPITPIQILWVNLITAVTLGLALAFEPTEKNTMSRPPRNRNEAIITGHLVWYIIFVSTLFSVGVFGIFNYSVHKGHSIELARTMALNTLVAMEIFQLFFIRNIYGSSLNWQTIKATKVVWVTTLSVTAAQFAITYLSVLQNIFATESVPLFEAVLIFIIGICLFVILETEKQIRLRIFK